MTKSDVLMELGQVESLILPIRGNRVVLDRDLARLYGTTTKKLNQAVRRNLDRFPPDFMIQLSAKERESLVLEFDHLSGMKHSKTLPFAFSEHGVIMAASVLNSPRAVEVSVLVVRAFVKLRELLFTHKELAKKFTELESRLANHDVAIQQLLYAIRKLMDEPAAPPKSKIGFR